MTTLGSLLARTFRPAPQRRPDTHRKAREEAKRIAAAAGIEIERLRDGGFNVWPPKGWQGDDPFEGDHYCQDWGDIAKMVRTYGAQS